jgi:hypothetical protein
MKNQSIYISVGLLLVCLGVLTGINLIRSGNTSEVNSIEGYLKWLENPANGLTKKKVVNNLKLKAKYLPQQYLLHRELGSSANPQEKQQLSDKYKGSINFLFSIKPEDSKMGGNSLIWFGVSSYQEYKQQVNALNFRLDKYLTLETDQGSYRPVLTHLQNYHNLKEGIDFMIAFAPTKDQPSDLTEASTYNLVFDDRFFGTGISRFVFQRDDIEQAPAINFE